MNNYKITNKKTKVAHLMNGGELANFMHKNNIKNYSIKNLTEQKKQRINNFLNFVAYVSIIVASMLMTTIYINTYC